MKTFIMPEGNGQKVYLDLDFVNSYDPLFVPDDAETNIKWKCNNVIEYLIDLGYDVITDSKLVDDGTFCFTPCLDKHIYEDVSEYVSNKDKKIKDSLALSNVREPITLRFTSAAEFPKEVPTLPFVVKNESENGGIDKILIEDEKQLEIFKRFYDEINEYWFQEAIKKTKKFWHLGDEIVFNEDGTSNSAIEISRIDFKKLFHDDFVMQEYISTPTEFNTSLRVVVSSSLDVLCASLKYSKVGQSGDEKLYGKVDCILLDKNSPYYLGSSMIVSNTVAGGDSILLGKNAYSEVEQEVLRAHDIDPDNAVVPIDVYEAAIRIIKKCHREIGAISGIDFIYDSKTQSWNFLEQHEYPMMNTYCEAFELPCADSDDLAEFIETQCVADLNARLRALSLFMEKKKEYDSDCKIVRKK